MGAPLWCPLYPLSKVISMNLFHKKVKKKPITDKAKEERNQKVKHVIKVILDVIIYAFAILMALALAVGGSCSPKSASAYYHSDNGYTSINSVVVTSDSSTTLRYYYDYNYKKTFPKWDTLFDCFGSSSNGYVGLVAFVSVYNIDNVSYSHLGVYKDNVTYYYRVINKLDNSFINFVTITQSDIVINRSDILTGIFNGVFLVKPVNIYIDFYRYLTYYFGELGYNRISYSLPINISSLAYLFVDSDNTDNLIENGYFFKNINLPYDSSSSEGQSTFETVFLGSFRSNGVYYSSITFTFSSVYGNVSDSHGNYYPIWYSMPGGSGTILSSNEFYKGYWYIDTITFNGYGINTLVWRAFNIDLIVSEAHWQYEYVGSWVGDSPYSSSPYRDLIIYYANDSFSGLVHNPYLEYYPQLASFNYADFLNFIGEAYPSAPTRPTDYTPPFTSVFEWLRIALNGAMPFFSYTLLPGITIGTLIMVPITMSIILFVVKLFKR